jgi:hypothetical protein
MNCDTHVSRVYAAAKHNGVKSIPVPTLGYFTSSRSGYAARSFDQMWQQRYWRPGSAAPPAMQMPLADAIKLLGVPTDFSREDIVAAFRRKALQCHPDHGGTEAQFIESPIRRSIRPDPFDMAG